MAIRSFASVGFTATAASANAKLPNLNDPNAPYTLASFQDKSGNLPASGDGLIIFEPLYRFTNTSFTAGMFIRFGKDNTVVATSADIPVNVNNPMIIRMNRQWTWFAFIGAAASVPFVVELITGENE